MTSMISPTRRILLVDDQPLVTHPIKLQLERTGRFIVLEENNPTLALAVARDFNPDVILLDVNMPEMNGWEVARQIQEDKRLEHTHLVFLTSEVTRTDALARNSTGNFHFIAKPVPPSILTSILDWLLSRDTAVPCELPLPNGAFLHPC